MKISQLVDDSHAMALQKGWWHEDRSPAECLALIHSEVSEALECLRICSPGDRWRSGGDDMYTSKPEGFVYELADVLIRIGDLCGRLNLDLESAVIEKMKYNATRSIRHGGKNL